MLFSSNIFIWIFLPFTLFLYYLIHFVWPEEKVKLAIKNILLTLMSLLFYAWGGVGYLFIMLASIVTNYIAGLIIGKNDDKQNIRKTVLIFAVLINIGMLFYYKYFNMFVAIVENIIAGKDVWQNILMVKRTYSFSFKDVVLPIGISFFTFQALSYVIDVYRRVVEYQKNIIDFALYVSFFPQRIAGPIVKYKDIKEYISNRKESIDLFVEGIKRFCYGLGKKVILANTFAEVVDSVWGLEINNIGALLSIVTCILYALQLYYDFSGYSDMAIGLGKMFGFKIEENFNYPYISLSITEYWRRWHISLSTWFKEYIYIPLGGN
ncbi:MAG: MBOAT family protein, partial [Lachnospiraceae bacterium]|nr:MBOAT family protein [Lachnospiraceae bacterium]